MTECSLGKRIVIIDGLDEVMKEQKAIGNNINQLAVLCHQNRITAVNLDKLVEQYVTMNKSLHEMLERKRWSFGSR